MQERTLFGVAVRVGAGYFILRSVVYFVHIIMKVIGMDLHSEFSLREDAAWLVAWLALGLILFQLADRIVAFVYPEKRGST